MSTAIHRVKLPTELLSLFLHIGIHRSRRVQLYRSRSNNNNNDTTTTELDGFITERSQRELSINSLGILLTTVAPLSVLIRQLVVSWLLARGLRYHVEIIRPPVRKRRGSSSRQDRGEKNLGFACRFQTNSTTYLTISTSSLLFPRRMDS